MLFLKISNNVLKYIYFSICLFEKNTVKCNKTTLVGPIRFDFLQFNDNIFLDTFLLNLFRKFDDKVNEACLNVLENCAFNKADIENFLNEYKNLPEYHYIEQKTFDIVKDYIEFPYNSNNYAKEIAFKKEMVYLYLLKAFYQIFQCIKNDLIDSFNCCKINRSDISLDLFYKKLKYFGCENFRKNKVINNFYLLEKNFDIKIIEDFFDKIYIDVKIIFRNFYRCLIY
ncbi:hypothetical protein GVAV_003002 [Gurleya vavrai]